MQALNRFLCWVLVLAMVTANFELAYCNGGKGRLSAPKVEEEDLSEAELQELLEELGEDVATPVAKNKVKAAETADEVEAVDKTPKINNSIKKVWVVGRSYPKNQGLKAVKNQLENNLLESIELRYYTEAAESGRTDLYFEAIHHWGDPKKADELLGRRDGAKVSSDAIHDTKFVVPNPTVEDPNATMVRYGLNYDDYTYSASLLRKSFDKLWGPTGVWARKVGSGAVAGSSLIAIYLGLRYMATHPTKNIIILTPVAKKVKAIMEPIGVLANIFEIVVVLGMGYSAASGVYGYITDGGNEVVMGPEEMERDWLHRIITAGYKYATDGTIPDVSAFDIEGTLKGLNAVESSAAKGEKNPFAGVVASENEPKPKYVPEVILLPLKNQMPFAVGAFRNFFAKYAEDKAIDLLDEERPSSSAFQVQ